MIVFVFVSYVQPMPSPNEPFDVAAEAAIVVKIDKISASAKTLIIFLDFLFITRPPEYKVSQIYKYMIN